MSSLFPGVLLACLIVILTGSVWAIRGAARDHKAGFDWSAWQVEVRSNGVFWVNAQTAEVLTPEQMDGRAKASLVLLRGGRS